MFENEKAYQRDVITKGLGASPGAAVGKLVFTAGAFLNVCMAVLLHHKSARLLARDLQLVFTVGGASAVCATQHLQSCLITLLDGYGSVQRCCCVLVTTCCALLYKSCACMTSWHLHARNHASMLSDAAAAAVPVVTVM
jgi:hypothetical protein